MPEKDISLEFQEQEIYFGQELHGKIKISYPGRFDTIVINSQIENSNDVFNYINLNGKKINHLYARLSIFKKDLDNKEVIDFTAITSHTPTQESSKVKFRTSIIQEHKEVANDIIFLNIKNKKEN